jgi:hypothetical protein
VIRTDRRASVFFLSAGKEGRAPEYHALRSEYSGVFYDSKFEAQTAMSLDWRLRAKEIKVWLRQFPKFIGPRLLPKYRQEGCEKRWASPRSEITKVR